MIPSWISKSFTHYDSANRLCGLLFTWFLSTSFLYLVWSHGPQPEGLEKKPTFPRDAEDLKELAIILAHYRDDHYLYILVLFSLAYLYKQTFAIPGSFFMNLLSGALFGAWLGSAISCSLTVVGSSFCFLLSSLFAGPIIERNLASRLKELRRKISTQKHRMFAFLLGARIFPFTPHWLLNICSPFAGIHLSMHAATIGIGLIPYNVLCVRAGRVLSEFKSARDVLDPSTLLELALMTLLLFAIAMYGKKRQSADKLIEIEPLESVHTE